MKKFLSIILMLTTLISALPIYSAAALVNDKFSDDIGFTYSDEVYYTDLFTMYSRYLYSDGMADIVNTDYQILLSEVYDDFKCSGEYSDMINAYGLTSGIVDVIKMYTDTTGDTNFAYNDALDEANELFITNIFAIHSVTDSLGADTRIMQYLNLGAEIIDDCLKELEVEYEHEVILEEPEHVLVWFKDTGVHYFETRHKKVVTDVITYSSENLEQFKAAFSVGKTALDMIKALYMAVVMECIRGDIVNDILAYAEPGTALHDGLTRLDRQLGDNMADYIINTYIVKAGIKAFEKAAEDWIIGRIFGNYADAYNTVSLVVKAAATIVYDFILDVPQFSEVTSYMVLARYADDMCNCIKRMQTDLATGVHDGHTIVRYENLWTVYAAVYKAVLSHGQKLANDSNDRKLQAAYREYFGTNYNLYSRTIDRILSNVKDIPFEKRIINSPEEMTYKSSDLAVSRISEASNEASDDTVYLVNGYLYGCLSVSGEDTDLGDLLGCAQGIAGDLTVNGSVLTVSTDKTYTVDGNLLLTGFYEWAWNGYAYYYGTVDIKSSLTVTGSISNKDDSKYYRMKMSEGSVLYLYGDQLIGLDTSAGTVVFCGNEAQQIMGNHKNVAVNNPEGVNGDFSLYGELDANSTPVEGEVYLCGNASMTDDTRLQTAVVSSDYTMQSNIYADTLYIHKYTMTVPVGSAFTVDGDIYISGDYSMAGGYTYYYGTLDIMGDLTVTGNIGIKEDSRYQRLKISDKNGVLRLMGELNMSFYTNLGTVVFCGTEQQTVSGTHNNIVVTNPEGVKGSVGLYGNFNSNGNPFEGEVYLFSNATLADDGTNYKNVYITKDFILQSNIYADSVQIKGCDLYVAEGTAYVIDADVDVYGYYDRGYYRAALRVYGDLTLKGNVTKTYYGTVGTEENSVLRFAGDSQQTIDGLLNVYTVVLENESDEGVNFTTNIKVLTLFNHKRNNYTAGASSVFVDYDGDGILDNEDKVPTIASGDVNGDGKVNGLDSNLLVRVVSGNTVGLSEENILVADYNNDGKTDARDANLIMRKIAGLLQ